MLTPLPLLYCHLFLPKQVWAPAPFVSKIWTILATWMTRPSPSHPSFTPGNNVHICEFNWIIHNTNIHMQGIWKVTDSPWTWSPTIGPVDYLGEAFKFESSVFHAWQERPNLRILNQILHSHFHVRIHFKPATYYFKKRHAIDKISSRIKLRVEDFVCKVLSNIMSF